MMKETYEHGAQVTDRIHRRTPQPGIFLSLAVEFIIP